MFGGSGGSAAFPSQVPYIGQLSTRVFLPNSQGAGSFAFNSRVAHYARGKVISLQVGFPNFYVQQDVGEQNGGNAMTVTASIEYPAGVFNQLKFGGSTSVSVTPGSFAISDILTISIPNGALFFTRWHLTGTNYPFCNANNPTPNVSLGDALESSATDKSISGTIVDGGSGNLIPPCFIVGPTTLPTIAMIGDSRSVGNGDTTLDANGDTGYARLFGPKFAYLNYGIYGDNLSPSFLTGSPNRLSFALKYCSHMFLCMGINDLSLGATDTQVIGYLQTAIGLWARRDRVLVGDLMSETGSSDSWATTANQSIAPWDSLRTSVNSFIGGLTGINQVIKIAAQELAPSDTWQWLSNGTANFYTADGTHESTNMLNLLVASGAFNSNLIAY